MRATSMAPFVLSFFDFFGCGNRWWEAEVDSSVCGKHRLTSTLATVAGVCCVPVPLANRIIRHRISATVFACFAGDGCYCALPPWWHAGTTLLSLSKVGQWAPGTKQCAISAQSPQGYLQDKPPEHPHHHPTVITVKWMEWCTIQKPCKAL